MESRRIFIVKTLSIAEAAAGLDRWVTLAAAGERIRIRKGDAVVELRLASPDHTSGATQLSPLEALRRLQEEAHLTPAEAERYLSEVRRERLTLEDQRPA
jgi:hypothetical protein